MSYCVYIIYSEKLKKHYIGTTDIYSKRLEEHNNAVREKSFTARGIPWKGVLCLDGLHSSQAYAMEKHIKSMKSTTYIENLIKYPELKARLIQRFK